MELMTSLQSEHHTSKELAMRLGQQEDELKELREQVGHASMTARTCAVQRRVDCVQHSGHVLVT